MEKCRLPFEFKPDGEHPLDPCLYTVKEHHENVTVEIWECMECGHQEIVWYKQNE